MKTAYVILLVLIASFQLHAQNSTGIEEPKVFTFVEQMPEFPGGDGALMKFLQENITYPQMERDNDIQGRVIVRFVILEDGSVSDVSILRGASPGLDKEATRVVKTFPKFKPGMQQGKPVKVFYNIPIVFKLEDKNPKEDKMWKQKIQSDSDFRNAILNIKDNDYKKAITNLKKSIKAHPEDYITYEIKGELELKLKNKKEACKNLEEALKKGSPNAQKLLNDSCK